MNSLGFAHPLALILLLLLVLPVSPVAAAETPYERKMADPEHPTDPYYESDSTWDAATRGPLPRHEVDAEGRRLVVPDDPDRSLTPYRLDLVPSRSTPTACTIESPPEYSPTEGVLYRYGAGWNTEVTALVTALTASPTHDETAFVVVTSVSQRTAAQNEFAAASADMSKVEFIIMPSDSIWLRDYGPHFILQGGARAIVDSHYYPTRPLDNFIPSLLADDYFVMPRYEIGLYYSGGNFQPATGRHGFTTSLVHDHNPGFGEPRIAELYGEYQGIDTLHIFPRLPSSVDGTGHIDMWFYLVDEDTVIISEFLPGSDPTAITITDNAAIYMEGLGYEVFRVPAWNAGGVHYTYTNAFRVNDRIFTIKYRDGNLAYKSSDLAADLTWKAAAGPGVEIIPINAYDIIWASGAFHCIVMQVPRYTDPLPSACLGSPSGGELLVPGTSHEIRWVAGDDSQIASVDLAYSADGGLTFPPSQAIATGEPDDLGFSWSVPLIETTQARVRVTAVDDDNNTVHAASQIDFAIESALQHVYDFSGGGGVDKWAYGSQTPGWSAVDGVRRPSQAATPLSSANLARIAVSDATSGDSDANRYVSGTPSSSSESTHIFEFLVEEDPLEIRDIGIHWEGYADDCAQIELYVWDDAESQWCDGRGGCGQDRYMDNFAGNRDEDLDGHIRADFDRYIDPNGLLTLMLYAERSGDRSFHDYVSVTVTHDPCAGADLDFDGYADLCDNCPSVHNVVQNNDDGDLLGNACDCAPVDSTVFRLPGEIRNVTVQPDKSTLTWDSDADNSGSGTEYQVLRGAIGGFPVGTGIDETCLSDASPGTTLLGLEDPTAASGHYYLVRGSNSCATGTYGLDSGGGPRGSAVCP